MTFTENRHELCQMIKNETNVKNIIEMTKKIAEINRDIARHKSVWESLLNKFHSDCSVVILKWNEYVLSYQIRYPDGYISEHTVDTMKHGVLLY